jgi:hypothetical protein
MEPGISLLWDMITRCPAKAPCVLGAPIQLGADQLVPKGGKTQEESNLLEPGAIASMLFALRLLSDLDQAMLWQFARESHF